jgi:hypothetical protein
MACSHCDEVNQTVEIRSPSDLEKVVRVVKANLADGTLASEPPTADAVVQMPPFDGLQPSGPWPDYLEYVFCCTHCGQGFRLDAETYHGAGGRWRPL